MLTPDEGGDGEGGGSLHVEGVLLEFEFVKRWQVHIYILSISNEIHKSESQNQTTRKRSRIGASHSLLKAQSRRRLQRDQRGGILETLLQHDRHTYQDDRPVHPVLDRDHRLPGVLSRHRGRRLPSKCLRVRNLLSLGSGCASGDPTWARQRSQTIGIILHRVCYSVHYSNKFWWMKLIKCILKMICLNDQDSLCNIL